MGRGLVVAVSVVGVPFEGSISVLALTKTVDALSSDDTTVVSKTAGEPGAVLKPSLKLPAGVSDYTFEVRGADDAIIGSIPITGHQLKLHAELTAKVRAQGGIAKEQDMLLRVPMGAVGPSAALLLDVDLGASAGVAAGAAAEDMAEELEVSVYLSAHGIVATRGAATDSFARVMLVTEGETEWEMGRTEVVYDDLAPQYRTAIRFTYTRAALLTSDSIVRLEVCDPQPAPDAEDLFTVVGAAEVRLADSNRKLSDCPTAAVPGINRPSLVLLVNACACAGICL